MQPKILKTENANFDATEWSGKNESGAQPIGDHVLVMPDKASEFLGKSKTLIAPEDLRARNSLAAETGILVACGTDAFAFTADRNRWEGEKPKPGDRIYYQRYAGQILVGDDDETYRCMSSSCVGAVRPGK